MSRYNKLIAALLAGLVVAVPALAVAYDSDNTITLGEWLTVLGLFLPAVATALSAANKLTPEQLAEQLATNPNQARVVQLLRGSSDAATKTQSALSNPGASMRIENQISKDPDIDRLA